MNKITGDQLRFLKDLVKDAKRIFGLGAPDKTDRDFINWLGGVFRKHCGDQVQLQSMEDAAKFVETCSSFQARKLIQAMTEMNERMEKKLPREMISTPEYLRKAIWGAARGAGLDKEIVDEIAFDVTGGETGSTKNLRKAEAVELLKRVQPAGGAKIQKMTQRSDGGKPYLRKS